MSYEHLCDLQILLGFSCILLELNVCILSLNLHKWGKYLCVISIIEICQGHAYMCSKQSFNFIIKSFWAFKLLFKCKCQNIQMKWISNLNFDSIIKNKVFRQMVSWRIFGLFSIPCPSAGASLATLQKWKNKALLWRYKMSLHSYIGQPQN
jgi:hypothetical protein